MPSETYTYVQSLKHISSVWVSLWNYICMDQ